MDDDVMGMGPVPFPYGHPAVSAVLVVIVIIVIMGVAIAVARVTATIARVVIAGMTEAKEGGEAKPNKGVAMVMTVICFGGRGHGNHARHKSRSGKK